MDRADRLRALGAALREARRAEGITLVGLRERLHHSISTQTLRSYESGIRACSVPRLFDLCSVLNTTPGVLLGKIADERPVAVPGTIVDLDAIVERADAELSSLKRWAAARLVETGGRRCTVSISSPAIAAMAQLCGLSEADLADRLSAFRTAEDVEVA